MFSKKQFRILLLSAMVLFFIIALFMYMFYIRFKPKEIKEEPLTINSTIEDTTEEKRIVMAQNVPRVQASTNLVFEIVDQFGLVTQADRYPGINWKDYTEGQIRQMFPDYVITKFEEDEVILTRVIERQIEPNYILTTQNENIVISIERNGYKIFYKETGLGQHDFSVKLGKVLDKGIPITLEQKDAILEDGDELYIILQEYD